MTVLREILDPRFRNEKPNGDSYEFWGRIGFEWLYISFEPFRTSGYPDELRELLNLCPHQWMHVLVEQNKLCRGDYTSLGFHIVSWLDKQVVLKAPSTEQTIQTISKLISGPDDGEYWNFFLSNSETCEFNGGYRLDMDSYELLKDNPSLFEHHIRVNLDFNALELFTKDEAIFDKLIDWSKSK